MAEVKIEEVVDHLSSDMRRALEEAVREAIPGAVFDSSALCQSFIRAVGRACHTWEKIPDKYVRE
jgi:hypothetical protein